MCYLVYPSAPGLYTHAFKHFLAELVNTNKVNQAGAGRVCGHTVYLPIGVAHAFCRYVHLHHREWDVTPFKRCCYLLQHAENNYRSMLPTGVDQ